MKSFYKYSLIYYHGEFDEADHEITSKHCGVVCGDGYAEAMKEIITEYGEYIEDVMITLIQHGSVLELKEDYFSKLDEEGCFSNG